VDQRLAHEVDHLLAARRHDHLAEVDRGALGRHHLDDAVDRHRHAFGGSVLQCARGGLGGDLRHQLRVQLRLEGARVRQSARARDHVVSLRKRHHLAHGRAFHGARARREERLVAGQLVRGRPRPWAFASSAGSSLHVLLAYSPLRRPHLVRRSRALRKRALSSQPRLQQGSAPSLAFCMNGIVFYIGLGLGLATACGLRPYLPTLLAGALGSAGAALARAAVEPLVAGARSRLRDRAAREALAIYLDAASLAAAVLVALLHPLGYLAAALAVMLLLRVRARAGAKYAGLRVMR